MKVQAVGICWYAPGDYPEILHIMEDAHLLPASYDEWKKKAELSERERTGQGVRVVRAVIDPKTFPAWCRARGLNVNAKARIAFANLEARHAIEN